MTDVPVPGPEDQVLGDQALADEVRRKKGVDGQSGAVVGGSNDNESPGIGLSDCFWRQRWLSDGDTLTVREIESFRRALARRSDSDNASRQGSTIRGERGRKVDEPVVALTTTAGMSNDGPIPIPQLEVNVLSQIDIKELG